MRLSYMSKSIGAYLLTYSGEVAPIVKVQDNDKCVVCYKYTVMEEDEIHSIIINNYIIPSGKVKNKDFNTKKVFYYDVDVPDSVIQFIKNQIDVYKEDYHYYYYTVTNTILLAIMDTKETDIAFYALDPTDEKVLKLFNNFESKVSLHIIKNTYSATPKVYSNYLPEAEGILVKAYKTIKEDSKQ